MAEEKSKKTRKRFYEPKCSPMQDIQEWKVDENGHHILVKVGEKNLDDEIQLYKDSTDIKILVDKIQKGDATTLALLQRPVAYGDVNDFPEECHPNALDDSLKQFYDNQPDSIKEKYPHYEDFKAFFLGLTAENIANLFKAEKDAADKADADKKAAEAAAAQAQLDAQAAAIAKALGGTK